MLLLILTDCYVYEIVDGEINGRFDSRNQSLSLIQGGCVQPWIWNNIFFQNLNEENFL